MGSLPGKFFEALRIRDSLQNLPGIIVSKIHLSKYYAFCKDTLTARKYASEAYQTTIKYHHNSDRLVALELLSSVDPKNATKYSAEYYKISDSLEIAERKTRNKFARIEYETDEITQQKNELLSQRRLLLFGSLGLLLVVGLIFVIRVQRAKNRELRLIQQQQAANEEIYQLLLASQQQRDAGRQEEKRRIARELHDGVMGRLTAIRLNLFVLQKRKDAQTIDQCLPHIDSIQDVEKEIRSIAYDLDTNMGEGTDFVAVLRSLFTALEAVPGVALQFQVDPQIDWHSIDVNLKVQLCRILQEAEQNIVKYAAATKVVLDIRVLDGKLKVVLSDNGQGFDYEKASRGLGLRNMEERARELGGTMRVVTAPGQGTRMEWDLPC